MNKLILVFYIQHQYLQSEEVIENIDNITQMIGRKNTVTIILPTDGDNRVECINPKFIVSQEIYDETTGKIQEINEYFKQIIEKNEKL